MSFWAGVVQGVKDIDVLKEKEALADERQSVRDQENAYREQIRLYNEKRDGIADARNAALDAINVEKWGFEKAQMGQSVLDAANGLGIGGPTATGGGGGGGSVPTPDAIKDSGVKFGGWLDTQLSDETLSQEDVDYLTNVSESFVDPKDAHEYWSVVTGIRETTGQMPTVAQLRASVTVTQVPGYADNKKKAVETLAVINNLDVSTPEGLAQATTLYNQLKKIDLNAATIDADTSSFLNTEDLGRLHTRQVEILDTELATNWLSVEDKAKLDLADGVSKDILMADLRKKYGPQALEALTGSYPQQFNRYADNPAFRNFIGGPSSNTPIQGNGTGNGAGGNTGPAQTAEEQRRRDAFINNPEDPIAKAEALEAFGKDAVEQMTYSTGFTAGAVGPDGKLGGGSYGIEAGGPVSAEDFGVFPEASAVAIREQYGEAFGQEGAQKVADTVKTVWNRTGEYMLKGADRGTGMVVGSALEVGSWLGVGLGFVNETIGLDGTDWFEAAGELDEVSGNLWNNGISAAEASQKIADIWSESLTRDTGDEARMADAYGSELKVPPTREEINTGSTPEGAAIKEAINSLVSGVQQIIPVTDSRQRIGTVGFQDTGVRPAESGVQGSPEGASDTNLERMEQSRLGRVGAESDRLSTESKSMPDGYRPPAMGATELNLPKILEALSPETRKIVEAELQVTSGDTNLGRMEQSRLDRVGMESDRLSTESKSMPNGYTPTQMGATELSSPKVRSALDSVTAEYVAAKGEPLAPEEELAVGIEAIVKGLSGNGMDQAELDDLIIELQEKFGDERVQEALVLAMNQ